MPDLTLTFGAAVIQARNAKDLKQKDLAAQLRQPNGQLISHQYLNDIERDRRNPPAT